MVEIDAWQWWILGLVLMGAEVILPGAFLLWIGLSALMTGFVVWLIPEMSSAIALLIFGLGSVLFAIWGNRFVKARRKPTDHPHLNERAAQYIGRKVRVTQRIENGQGKVRVGDTQWLALGEDAPEGAEVIVVGVQDTALVVKALNP